jgi:uncharacterized membrane protein
MLNLRTSPARNPHTPVVFALAAVALAGASAWLLTKPWRPMHQDKDRPDMPTLAGGRGLSVERCVTVMRPADELYRQWRNLARLPELMPHLRSVTVLDEKRSHWVAAGARGGVVEWDARLVADEPGRLIAWRSVEGADVDNAGSVTFTPAPGDRGTEIRVIVRYAPAGHLGTAVAPFFRTGVDRQVREDLRRFKQRMEAQEVAVAARDAGQSARTSSKES